MAERRPDLAEAVDHGDDQPGANRWGRSLAGSTDSTAGDRADFVVFQFDASTGPQVLEKYSDGDSRPERCTTKGIASTRSLSA